MTPIVALLVSITEYGGNILAELFFRASSFICFQERKENIVPEVVRSTGLYQLIVPLVQKSEFHVDGVPHHSVSMKSQISPTSHPSGIMPNSVPLSTIFTLSYPGNRKRTNHSL